MSAVGAQAPADAESVDSAVINLPIVEVVANAATSKTPVAFTNVSRRELDKNNDGRDIPYLLGATPSFITTSDAGAGVGYTSLRVRGTDGSRINVTANGIPINNSESHNVYWVNMPDLTSSLRDIQIQRGVGTSTNGAGAFGASINMITDAPSDEAYAELSGAYGSYNTNRETLRVGSGLLGGHWSFDARLSHIGSDGYIERAASELWSYFGQAAYQSYNTNVRLIAFGGKEKTYMAWDYASLDDMKEYGRRYNPCGEYVDTDGNIAYYPDQNDNYIQHHFQLHLAQRLGGHWRLNAALHYTKDDGYYEQYKTKRTLYEYGLDPFYLADGTKVKKSDLVRLKKNDNSFGGATLSATMERERIRLVIGGAANWFYGCHFGQVAWVRNYVGDINPLQRYYDNKGRKFDSNLYSRADWDIVDGLTAYGDVQVRHINYTIRGISDNFDYTTDAPAILDVDRHWTFFNPKLGLNYTTGAHRVYASWSVAHKEPTRDNFTDGDIHHRPEAERLFDYEVGYNYSAKNISAGVNFYYMDYKDQLVATGQLSDTGNPLSVNVPSSYRMGVELQAQWRPLKWFTWDINATLSRNRIKNFVEYIYDDDYANPITIDCGNTSIAFSPDLTLANTFTFNVKGFDASVQTRYVSRQYMANTHSSRGEEASATSTPSIAPYCVTDLHVGYTIKGLMGIKSMRVGASVYNVLSRKYFNNGYAGAGYYVDDAGQNVIYRYAGYAAQAPAHVLATVTLKF
ncbi:MAG: TonB-dependent receptor plug domain-containing protein [Muribaculum sp.]|nr:TonB-dependent receptor plug domain-containing protein [Muribaculum sp.]